MVENTALLKFWHLRCTPLSVPLNHTESNSEPFRTQEIKLANEVNLTFMGETPHSV